MRRRARAQPSSLTSLLDVLFIVAFASLAQATARVELAADANAGPDPESAPPAAEPEPPTPRELSESKFYARAIVELTEANEDRPAALVRISAAGTITAVSEKDTAGVPQALDIPLLVADPNPDVALVYRGRESADARVCQVVRTALGGASLEGTLVVLAPEVPLARLPVALVSGLRDEPTWCLRDERAFAVVVDPALIGERDERDGEPEGGVGEGPGAIQPRRPKNEQRQESK